MYNGKVKCISNVLGLCHIILEKIYEFKDGKVIWENGIFSYYDSFDDLKNSNISLKFIEIKDENNILTEIKWDGKNNIDNEDTNYSIFVHQNYIKIGLFKNVKKGEELADIDIRYGDLYKTTLEDVNKILAIYDYKIVIEEPKYKLKLDGEYSEEEIKKLEGLGIKFEKEKV